MKPGFVFELPQRIDQIEIDLVTNGTTIGRGELVAVDDQLGIRLREIDVNGVK